MIRKEFEDYQRGISKKWKAKNYFLQEVYLNKIFNWKNTNLKFNSPISLITGKNGIGKSTFINALKQVYDLQNGKNEFGILSLLEDYEIKLVDQNNKEFIVKNKKIVKQDFSLPTLKDLTFNTSLYAYYKNSTGSEMIYYLKTLQQYDTKSLPGDLLSVMRELIGKQIISAEKIIDQEVEYEPLEEEFELPEEEEPTEEEFEPPKEEEPTEEKFEPPEEEYEGLDPIRILSNLEYYRLKLDDGTIYDSYTMGSGEFYINQFLWGLDSLSEKSIVVIEELENFIHPEAQKKILELIHKYSLKKNVQFILTTHSPTLIDHVQSLSRILIKTDSRSNIICINDCSSWLAKDHLGNKIENKIEVLIEDKKAIQLFKTIISQQNPSMLKQLILTKGEGESKIKKCVEIVKELCSSKIIGIIDGNSEYDEGDYLLKLPGDKTPEELIMAYIISNYDKVALKLDRDIEDVKTAFNSANTIVDPHEWFSNASSNLGWDFDVLWGIMTNMWCVENLKETTDFYKKFEVQFNKAGQF